ncbi:unnamed protein product [Heterobilharzia americana]|nr:unnamed protein product [Heterobilharzia americana]
MSVMGSRLAKNLLRLNNMRSQYFLSGLITDVPPPYPVDPKDQPVTGQPPVKYYGPTVEHHYIQHVGNTPSFIPGPDAGTIVCPYCEKEILTRTEYKTGLLTWIGCAGIFLLGIDSKEN